MNLHSEIMNVSVDETEIYYKFGIDAGYAYRLGHRDARHAAGVISLKGDRAIDLLWEIRDYYINEFASKDIAVKIKAFLEEIR